MPKDISDILLPENVIIGLAAPTKARLLQSLAERAGGVLGVDPAAILATLATREQLGSTGLGGGIAVPHGSVAGLTAPFGLLVRLAKPVDFEAIDGMKVDIVFLLLVPTAEPSSHLNALASVARKLRSPEVLGRMRAAVSADALHSALDADTQ